jgi:hypothetical protein
MLYTGEDKAKAGGRHWRTRLRLDVEPQHLLYAGEDKAKPGN